jgi:hypothetical protein
LDICNKEPSIVQLVALNTDARPSPYGGTIIVDCVVHTHKCLAISIHTGQT